MVQDVSLVLGSLRELYSLQDGLTIQGQVILDHLVRHFLWHPSIWKLMRWQSPGGEPSAIDIGAVARLVRKLLG